MRYLAFDLGSTFAKGMLIEDGRIIREAYRSSPANHAIQPARYETDAECYFRVFEELLHSLDIGEPTSLILSTQMHGFVVADAGFHPLTPYISWQDSACEEKSADGSTWREQLSARLDAGDFSKAGVPLKKNLALCNLYARVRSGLVLPKKALFCTLGGYIIGRLTKRHVCHLTNAAPTGMADVRSGCWNSPVIRQAGLDFLYYPQIISDLSPCASFLLNGRKITVFPDVGDQQVCALGAGLEKDTILHINIGTAGLLGLLSDTWSEGAFENRPWIKKGMYLRTVSGLPGGRLAAALHDDLLKEASDAGASPNDREIWDFMTHVQAAVPAREELEGMKDKTFSGLRRRFSAEEAVCLVYEEMAQSYLAASRGMKGRIEQLRFSGGCVLKNPALMKRIRDVFGIREGTEDAKDIVLGMIAMARLAEETAAGKD